MTENSFDFLKDHSTHYLEMAFRSDHRGSIEHPDGYGKRTGECGDTVEMYLSVRKGCIQSVAYQTHGCINTNACTNTVVRLAEGRQIADAWEISADDISEYLQTLPAENYHCAELAVGALYRALLDYNDKQQRPWKKLYSSR